MPGKRLVCLVQGAIEFLIDVAHLQQFDVGEIKQGADIIASLSTKSAAFQSTRVMSLAL